MVAAGSELIPGVSIDRRYRIQCTLGRGGFGRTYLAADDCRFGELCVLKEFVPSSEADPVVAQKLCDLFHREALVLHQLDHPQIPKFLAVVEEDDRLFIAQEYIDGKTYWQLLQERQPHGRAFSQREIIPWLRELLRVLEYLHQKNIVHRDISPDNIMLPRGGTSPVLIDFGVVKQVIPHLHLVQSGDPTDLVQASVSVGKFGYAPYEQIRMGQCSPRSDLYALAVTAVVLLTGKPPNLLMDEKSLEWQWQQCVRLDARLRKILEVMLAEKPQDRYPSATIVLEQLQEIDEAALAVDLQPTQIKPASGQSPSSQPALSNPSAGTLMEQPVAVAMTTLAHPISALTNQLQGTRWLTPSLVLPEGAEPHAITACTDIESAIDARPPSQLVWLPKPLAPRLSLRSLLSLVRIAVLRLPQDQQGNSRRLSLKHIFSLSFLLLLPLGGAVIGIQSPHMASVCWVLRNCADAEEQDQRYYQAIELAESAKTLSAQAHNLNDLQQARDRLADSIAQLNAFSGQLKLSVISILPEYQTLLQTLDQSLEKETRAMQLLSRAEAEAQKAIEQSRAAKTIQQYQEAQLQWKRVMATLMAIPKGSLVDRQVTARSQEYQTRLDAISVKVAAASPQPPATSTRPTSTQRTTPQPQTVAQRPPVQIAAAPISTPSLAVTQATGQPTTRSRSSRSTTQSKPVAQRPTRRSTSTSTAQTRRSSHIAQVPPSGNNPQAPSTSPLEVARRWIAGSVVTSATQTLDNVDIWIEGSRTEADGTFTANLMIRNRSGRGFGFVPVYAESQDTQGNTIRSRVLLTGPSDALLEPGELLSGKISLLDRPANARRLTLVIQESTSGDRSFRVPF